MDMINNCACLFDGEKFLFLNVDPCVVLHLCLDSVYGYVQYFGIICVVLHAR